jgi:cytochrome c oxidase subunit II
MRLNTRLMAFLSTVSGFLAASAAQAQVTVEGLDIIGAPTDRAMGFQPAATSVASDLQWLDNMLLWIITAITLFVLGAPDRGSGALQPARQSQSENLHPHTPIEVAWTVVPILILSSSARSRCRSLFKQQVIPEADMTIKVTGYQWFWGYEYVDHEFDSTASCWPARNWEYGYEDELPAGHRYRRGRAGRARRGDAGHRGRRDPFLDDPAFGVKQDGVPGRLAELWFTVEEGRHLFRPVFRALRQGACLHADHREGRERGGLRGMAGRAIEQYAGTPRPLQGSAAAAERPAGTASPRNPQAPGNHDDMTDAEITLREGEAGSATIRAAQAAGDVACGVHRAGRASGRAGGLHPVEAFARSSSSRSGRGVGRAEHVVGRRYRRADAPHRAPPGARGQGRPGRGAGDRLGCRACRS